jgi:hypothetical protein
VNTGQSLAYILVVKQANFDWKLESCCGQALLDCRPGGARRQAPLDWKSAWRLALSKAPGAICEHSCGVLNSFPWWIGFELIAVKTMSNCFCWAGPGGVFAASTTDKGFRVAVWGGGGGSTPSTQAAASGSCRLCFLDTNAWFLKPSKNFYFILSTRL